MPVPAPPRPSPSVPPVVADRRLVEDGAAFPSSTASTMPGPGEVHVWQSLEGGAGDAERALLDPTETARAARFRFDRDRVRYIAHHAFVRRVLGRYLGLDPAAVVVRQTVSGKPELEPVVELAFNTSRSQGLSVVAVSGAPVGIDVERRRRIDDALPLARGLFSPRERTLLESVPAAALDDAFLALWTRNEAVVKAFGRGLSVPLDAFDVCAADGGLSEPWQGTMGAEPFTVAPLELLSGWIAAVSVLGSRLAVKDATMTVRP